MRTTDKVLKTLWLPVCGFLVKMEIYAVSPVRLLDWIHMDTLDHFQFYEYIKDCIEKQSLRSGTLQCFSAMTFNLIGCWEVIKEPKVTSESLCPGMIFKRKGNAFQPYILVGLCESFFTMEAMSSCPGKRRARDYFYYFQFDHGQWDYIRMCDKDELFLYGKTGPDPLDAIRLGYYSVTEEIRNREDYSLVINKRENVRIFDIRYIPKSEACDFWRLQVDAVRLKTGKVFTKEISKEHPWELEWGFSLLFSYDHYLNEQYQYDKKNSLFYKFRIES